MQDSLQAGEAVLALVELTPPPLTDSETSADGTSTARSASTAVTTSDPLADDVAARAAYYQTTQQKILDAVAPDQVELITRYQNVPYLFVRIQDEHGLEALDALPEVLRVHAEQQYGLELAQSLPQIGQPAAAAAGKTGVDTSVAVLDTGCDFTRTDFGSCSSAGGNCKVAFARDFGRDDRLRDDNGHGTNVSAIVLGVAPDAKVLALDVFTGSAASSSSVIAAIDWTIQNRTLYKIAALNMSFGSGGYTAPCVGDVFASAVASARAAGIIPVAASGNNAFRNALASPACTPATVSVGAVYDTNLGNLGYSNCRDLTTATDRVACFSNSASFLSLLAPGGLISAGGRRMTGTSQAAPHVAGAIAVLRSAFPSESADELVTRLIDRGPVLTDPRNNISKHRLDLAAALDLSATPNISDTTPPTGSVVLEGSVAATTKQVVTLTVVASDAAGVATMCVSNTTRCSTFVPFAGTQNWTLSAGNGLKTVRVWLRDPSGNEAVLSDTITFDTKAPTGSALTARPADGQVALHWTAASDIGSQIAVYRLYMAQGEAPACGAGTLLAEEKSFDFTHAGLTNGSTYGYHVCPVDGAGNVGMGSTILARPAPEYVAPTGSVLVNDGASSTRTALVSLTLSASDVSGVAAMCISNTTTCTNWESYAPSKSWTLAIANGVATVYVKFRDVYGNVMTNPVTDRIAVDTLPPKGGVLRATASDSRVLLTWGSASDAGTRIARYALYAAPGTPPDCGSGTAIYEGLALTSSHENLENGATYGYHLCPVDGAGNVGAGSTALGRPAPEYKAPTGNVRINEGGALANSPDVTLTLTAMDESGVGWMCISNSSSGCTAWESYAVSRAWTLATTSGTASVYALFRDTYGNTMSTPVSAKITVDTTLPLDSSLIATRAKGKLTLSWGAAADTNTIASYQLAFAEGDTPPATCTEGVQLYSGLARTFVHAVSSGSVNSYRVCATDKAGNQSTGVVVTASPL